MAMLEISRRILYSCLIILALIGNTPHSGVEAQDGTTLRSSTLRPTIPRPKSTIRPSRATTLIATMRATGNMMNTGIATTRPVRPSMPVTVRPGASPAPTIKSSSTAVRETESTTSATTSTTKTSTVTESKTTRVSLTTTTTSTTTRNPTSTETTTQQSLSSAPAQVTTGRPSRGTTPPFVTGYIVQYVLPVDGSVLSNNDALLNCQANTINDLSTVLNIPQDRITEATCEKYSDSQNAITDKILVIATISPGSKPNENELNNIKIGSTVYKPNGPNGVKHNIMQGTFKYDQRSTSTPSATDTPTDAVASTNPYFLGLADTYWVLIGLGLVIVLLVVISSVVICIGRSEGGVRPESPEPEIQDGDLDTPQKKKRRFPWQRKKKDEDIESNRDASDSEQGESAYGSTPELDQSDHDVPYDRYEDEEDGRSGKSSIMQDEDKIV